MKMKKLGALLLAGVMIMSTLLVVEMVHPEVQQVEMPRRRRVEVMVRERKSQFS